MKATFINLVDLFGKIGVFVELLLIILYYFPLLKIISIISMKQKLFYVSIYNREQTIKKKRRINKRNVF